MAGVEEEERNIPYFFPDDHAIRFTLQVFPHSAAVKNAAGAPWACCVSPFTEVRSGLDGEGGEQATPPPPVPIDQIARCEECYAYICPFTEFISRFWKCALCGNMNRLTQDLARYRKKNAFQVLPELSQETVEFELPLDSKGAMMKSEEVLLETGYLAKEPAAARPLVYLAVVEESAGQEYHDVMAEVLGRCVDNLPDDCRFGVVTVSDRIGLVNLTAPLPHVQFVDMGLSRASASAGAAGAGAAGAAGVAGGAGGGGGGGSSEGQDSWPDPTGTVSLSDVMSLEELVSPLGENRARIAANVRGLRKACREKGAASGKSGERGTGLAIKLLLDLILGPGTSGSAANFSPSASSQRARGVGAMRNMAPAVERGRGFTFAGCRLMLFLGGEPNRGPGAVGVRSPGGIKEDQEAEGFEHDQLFRGEAKALGFYRGQAYRAASSGVSIDVHCFASKECEYFSLSSIAPLAMTTGGGVFRHSLLHQREGEQIALTLGKKISDEILQPRVYDGLLRVRTSAEFGVNRDGIYGNLSADPRLENLWHVASCSSGQTFAMDFEFKGGGGGADLQWDDKGDTSSTVQSAFAYTAMIREEDDNSGSNDDGSKKNAATLVTARRLRVSTVRTEASPKVETVWNMADPAAVSAVLMHKVISEARRSGLSEARGLLRDWLTNFIFSLPQNLNPRRKEEGSDALDNLEGILMNHPLVIGVARQVFGLLQSPLLHPTTGISDARVSLLSRLSSLDTESLSIALYPEMQGYADPDVRLANSLPLSREAVTEASPACRIFVVDTFWRVIVHYAAADAPATPATSSPPPPPPPGRSTASPGRDGASSVPDASAGLLPFPPPPDSAIGKYLEMRRAVRPLAGQEVIYSRPKTPEAFYFEEALLEDRPLPLSEKGQTFKTFFEELMSDALQA